MAEIDPRKFVRVREGVAWRGLEKPHLYHIGRDELYELDESGLALLSEIERDTRAGEISQPELLAYALDEGLVELIPAPRQREIPRGQSPVPSLRYLETMLTRRCNLKCAHCYLGKSRARDLKPSLLEKALAEFDAMQGLRVLLSGGEPLLYPNWEEVLFLFIGRGFRTVLLSNGLLLDDERLEWVPVQEVQLSLDGMKEGHEAIRGSGTFDRTVMAARHVRSSGRDLSIATMVHAGNLDEMDRLEELVRELGAREWNLEVPTGLGRWNGRTATELSPPLELAAAAMRRAFGGSYHGSAAGHACGFHLAALTPEGDLAPCGFYADSPLGNIAETGMRAAWERKKVGLLSEIECCRDCDAAENCGGGCRYRAGGSGPDRVMCAAYGKR